MDLGAAVSVEDAAAILNLSRFSVWKYVKDGRLPATKVGHAYVIARTDLDRFAAIPRRAVGRRRKATVGDGSASAQAGMRTLRFDVLARDGFTCRYCGRAAPAVVVEVDHVIPKYLGGTDEPNNLVTACYDCNRGKGDRLLPQSDID